MCGGGEDVDEQQGRGDVVVVTGASAGVGRAVAREFARRGARIGLVARGRDGLEGARRDVEEFGGEALVLPADVSDAQAVEQAADAVEERFGPIDVWVNNAMVTVFSPFAEVTADEYRRVTEVTYLGTVHGTMSALSRMKPRNRGAIVQVGSALAYRAIPLQSAYCGAKHAVQGFSESVRSELLHEGSRIRVTMVQLPAVNTPQFDWSRTRFQRKAQPVPPIFQPELVARAIVWAAYHGGRELTVGGSAVAVIWGNKLLPGVGDHYLARSGWESQLTDEPEDPERPDNLWQALPGDRGARGRFDAQSTMHSAQLWARTHPAASAVGAGVLLGLGLGLARCWKRFGGNDRA
jgi:short-subunit dehydrogenase